MTSPRPPFVRADLDSWASSDPYFRLRSLPDIDDEFCVCRDRPPLKVMQVLDRNPLHCMNCNLPVPPEDVPLPVGMVDEVASWSAIAQAFVNLDLDSQDYESLAFREQQHLGSALNRRGRDLAKNWTRSGRRTTGGSGVSR